MLISDTTHGPPLLRRSTVAYRTLQYSCVVGKPYVGWIRWRNIRAFAFATTNCSKLSIYWWRLGGWQRSVYDSYAAERRWRRKSVSRALPYGVEFSDDVDARMHILWDKVSSADAFISAQNEWVVSRTHCNPLCIWWIHLQPEWNLTAAMERTER